MRERFQNYISLMSFISKAIGPDFELSLMDTRDGKNRIIAMEYGNISGRRVGDDISIASLKAIEEEYKNTDYIANRTTFAKNGKALRTSMFFIKDDCGNLEGIMCINFDDSKYEELGKKIMFLCHPDKYIEERFANVKIDMKIDDENNRGESMTIEESIEAMVDLELKEAFVPVERLTPEEKVKIVRNLDQKGIFMLKGAVNILSKRLEISKATAYRYINMARED